MKKRHNFSAFRVEKLILLSGRKHFQFRHGSHAYIGRRMKNGRFAMVKHGFYQSFLLFEIYTTAIQPLPLDKTRSRNSTLLIELFGPISQASGIS
jgi:hypothetical protein